VKRTISSFSSPSAKSRTRYIEKEQIFITILLRDIKTTLGWYISQLSKQPIGKIAELRGFWRPRIVKSNLAVLLVTTRTAAKRLSRFVVRVLQQNQYTPNTAKVEEEICPRESKDMTGSS
jgi:hypothetical protein